MAGQIPRGALLALVSILAIGLPSTAAAVAGNADELILHIYDVSDLLRPRPDFPAPRLGLAGLEEAPVVAAEPESTAWTMEELVELIREALGAEIAASGGSISALGSNLVLSVPAGSQERVASLLGDLRDETRDAYAVEARWVELPAEAIAELRLPDPVRPGRALRLGSEEGERLLASLAARADAKSLAAPRLTVFARQRSHVLVLDQEAYVDRLEVDETGIADPVIEVMNTGIILEARVRPRQGREGIVLEWEARVARAIPPGPGESDADPAAAPGLAPEPESRIPEVTTVSREGRTVLAPGEFLVVAGLPSLASEHPTLLVISWRKAETEEAVVEER